MTLLGLESCSTTDTGTAPSISDPGFFLDGGVELGTGRYPGADAGSSYGCWQFFSNYQDYFRFRVTTVADRHGTFTVGFALRADNGSYAVMYLADATSQALRMRVYHDPADPASQHRISIVRMRDNVILGTTSIPVLTGGQFYYIEVKAVLSATVGSVEVRVNEVQRLLVTNVDTLSSSGLLVFDTVYWYNGDFGVGGSTLGTTFGVDDIYICNGAGSVNNTFLGDTTVWRLKPSAAGDLTLFTPSSTSPAGQTNWQIAQGSNALGYNGGNFGSASPNYNEATTLIFTDLYNYDDLPASQSGLTVIGVIVSSELMSQIIPRGGAIVSRLSALVEVESPTITLTTSRTGYKFVQETRPGGGTWTTADVNAAQHGVRVKS